MSTAKEISVLLDIADRAVRVHEAEVARKIARSDLVAAYVAWKNEHGVDRVERDSLDWIRMMSATNLEYEAFDRAQKVERNARRRLSDAIVRSCVAAIPAFILDRSAA